MNTVLLTLPTVLLLYFLWRSLRQRVFVLGLPFLMNMYYSIFFDRLRPFWIAWWPGEWVPADYMMLWLVATWAVYFDLMLPVHRRSVRARHLLGPRLSGPEEFLLLGFAAYMVFKIGTTAIHYVDLGSAISEARVPLYVFLGYLLLRGILCHAGRADTVDFLAAILVVNTIAAGFYVLHQGLHLYIYQGAVEYQYIVVNGEILTRSFYFMPRYLLLAVAFCAAKGKWNLLWFGVLSVTLAAIWVTYTRSLILVALVQIGVIVTVGLLKRRDAWPAVKRFLQISMVTGVFVVAAFTLLPAQSTYLFSRLVETNSSGSPLQDNNLQVRGTWWRTTNEWLGHDNRLLGAGFPSSTQDPRVTEIARMAPDLVWVPTVWNLGLVGVIGLAIVFLSFGWRALSMSLASDRESAFLPTVLFGAILGTFLLGFIEWTIFDPWHTPLALSFFALLSAETCRQRASAASNHARRRPVVQGGLRAARMKRSVGRD